MKKYCLMVVYMLVVSGCAEQFYFPSNRIIIAIKKHQIAESQIYLGDSKESVLRKLQPTQVILTPDLSKVPDRYTKQGVSVEIYYMRSGWQPDGLITDDEFTPYLFNDNKLVGIGWSALGIPYTNTDMKVVIY